MPSSSLIEVQVEAEVGVGVEVEVGVGVVKIVQLFSKMQMYFKLNLDAVTTYTGGWGGGWFAGWVESNAKLN